MYIAQNLFEEIHKFLNIDLLDENLTSPCRLKLSDLIYKLETTINHNNISRTSIIYDDYNIYEEPCKKENQPSDFNFELPTKLVRCRNDFQSLTLLGPLYYRYNLQCWEHYPFSMLIDGRLICSKFSPNNSINTCNLSQLPIENHTSSNSGKSSELSIFLMGYTAVMTWKDCGMNFVFKLTHPTEETKVFATETEEEALLWIEQINQYSLGATPLDVKILKDKSNNDLDTVDEFDFIAELNAGFDNNSVDEVMKINENSHLRRQPSDVLNIINNSTVTNPNFLISDTKFNRSRSNYSFKNVPVNGSPGNMNNNAMGSIGSGGGTSIISSMRRKVESFGNKYRNRKSFAGFSSKNFNFNGIPQSTSFSKAKTMSPVSPDDNRRSSLYSVQLYPCSKDLIYSGIAKLRLQGNRAGWMERWCQLKPKLLECYHVQSNNNGMKPALDFALCLENLTLGLSNDKKHRSALRLSCDQAKQDLLFEVQDKVLMGDWIKSFIEALGINNQKPIPLNVNSPTQTSNSQDPLDDIMHRSLTTIQSIGSDSIYDEVCSSDIKDPYQCAEAPPTPISNQRRWSSPAIELPGLKGNNSNTMQPPSAPYVGRRCLREHPLPSLPASSPDSENNSDNMADTPTGTQDIEVESVYDYSSTFGKNVDPSRTSTLKTKMESDTYPIFDTSLKGSIIYADQEPDDGSPEDSKPEDSETKFNDNKQHWRVQGCSLADLIARFEPHSESQDHSSATMSSKTDSSCTTTFQNSSEDNINSASISNSFMSIHSVEHNGIDPLKKVCRSVSADTDLGFLHHQNSKQNKKDRPKSLLMKKTSLELVFEELHIIKDDIRNLKKQKNELQKAQSQKSSKKGESAESVGNIILDIGNQIKVKESRIKELSNHSRKRFTLEIVTNLRRQSSRLSAD